MIRISDNHLIFELEPLVQKASSELLAQFGINYFQFLRCFKDGSFTILANDLRLLRAFASMEGEQLIYSSFEDAFVNKQSFWFSWDESLPSMPVTLAREMCSFHHGTTLVRREKNHYDMIAFALSKPHDNACGYFLSILPQLEWFIRQFEDNYAQKIQAADNNRIQLPPAHQDKNCQLLCLKNGRLSLSIDGVTSYITLKELNCVKRLATGLTYKEVAKSLKISPKTIETYMQRVKHRTGLPHHHPYFLSL